MYDEVDDTHANQSVQDGKKEVARVMGCATMWHENKTEMTEMVKSLFRIDEDYSAR